jgi:hypothetical protein
MIVDLRDYTVRADARDRLIERCEQALFPEQERLGARFVGTFRDADDPTRVVWLRAMPDLATRLRVLTAFYVDGMWLQHRDEVNGWLVDTDDVLLVRPVSEWMPPADGPAIVGMFACVRKHPSGAADARAREPSLAAAITAAGGRPLVTFATDPADNNFPRHPIRVGEHGRVWFATFPRRPAAVAVDGVVARWLVPTATSRLR